MVCSSASPVAQLGHTFAGTLTLGHRLLAQVTKVAVVCSGLSVRLDLSHFGSVQYVITAAGDGAQLVGSLNFWDFSTGARPGGSASSRGCCRRTLSHLCLLRRAAAPLEMLQGGGYGDRLRGRAASPVPREEWSWSRGQQSSRPPQSPLTCVALARRRTLPLCLVVSFSRRSRCAH